MTTPLGDLLGALAGNPFGVPLVSPLHQQDLASSLAVLADAQRQREAYEQYRQEHPDFFSDAVRSKINGCDIP